MNSSPEARRREHAVPKDATLASYVVAARRAQGVTWDDLVRSTGLSLGTIRKIEEGRTQNPGVFTVLSIWHALSLPLSALDDIADPTGMKRRIRA